MAFSVLTHHSSTSSLLFVHKQNRREKPYSLIYLTVFRPKHSVKSYRVSATPSSSSVPPIFLPLLDEPEQKTGEDERKRDREGEEEKEEEVVEEEVGEDMKDPIIRFFKSRTAAPMKDPSREGRMSLQKNRRSSWHLAAETDDLESDIEPVPAHETENVLSEDNDRTLGGLNGINGAALEILELARNLPENCTIGEVLGGFEKRVCDRECVEALTLMGQCGFVNSCLYFYEWMGIQEPSLVTPRACSVLFPLLGKEGMGDEIMVLFRNLPEKKGFRDVHVYNAAISGLLACKRYDDAWKVYEVMEVNNVRPDHVTCSIVITVMRKKGRSAKETWEFFEKMNRKGVKWSEEISGALIKSFCDEGLKAEALVIQTEMEKKGISSNTIVYNTLMDAYNKSNQIEEVEGLFAEMKAKGVKASTATFNILMDAYARRMQPEIVENLLSEMEGSGLKPDAKSYTCLISVYGKQKNASDLAANAFLRMKKAGIKPTSHSYTALIHAYSIGLWHEKAYAAFENMMIEGIKPSIETYTALLDAFRRAGDTQKLTEIWKLMMKDRIKATFVTFNTLLDGFAKQGEYDEARDVVCEFGKMGMQPTVLTYNMLMNAYARGGAHEKLPQLLNEMEGLNLKPDSVTYSTMIYAFVRVRDFKSAFYYHKMMVKSGQVPEVRSYEKLRAILENKAKTKNRQDKSAILGIINSKFGRVKPKRMAKKDEFWKNKRENRSETHDRFRR